MKEIYSFNINKKVKREVTEETENGKLVKTVEEEIPVKIIFKKPTRVEAEEADTVYAVEYGKCVRSGILTKALVEKLYDEKDKSGILSDDFKKKYSDLYEKFYKVQAEYTEATLSKKKQDKEKIKKLAVEFGKIKNELQALEGARNSLFQNTAETKAEGRTILWLALFLTYIQEEGQEPRQFFEGETFEDKLDEYDEIIEEGNEFNLSVIDRMAFYVTLYFLGRASTKEDFESIEKTLNLTGEPEEEEKKVEDETPKTD